MTESLASGKNKSLAHWGICTLNLVKALWIISEYAVHSKMQQQKNETTKLY